MKIRILVLLVSLLTLALPGAAKKEKSQSPSYAMSRAIEEREAENFPSAKEWIEVELSENPNDPKSLLVAAQIYYDLDEYADALNYINKSIKRIPRKDNEMLANAYILRGKINLCLWEIEAANADVNKAIELDPQNAEHYGYRAFTKYIYGDYESCIDDCYKAIELNPSDDSYYPMLGSCLKELDRLKEAEQVYTKMIRLFPEAINARNLRGQIYLGQERWGEACDDFLVALAAGDEDVYDYLSNFPEEGMTTFLAKMKIAELQNPSDFRYPYLIAKSLAYNDRPKEALSYFEKANNLTEDSVIWGEIAQCYRDLNNPAKALEALSQALALEPDSDDLIYTKGTILFDFGRFSEAAQDFSKYIAANPTIIVGYRARALSYMNEGHFGEAVADYETIGVLDPDALTFESFRVLRGDAYRLSGNQKKAREDYEYILSLPDAKPYTYDDSDTAVIVEDVVSLYEDADTLDTALPYVFAEELIDSDDDYSYFETDSLSGYEPESTTLGRAYAYSGLGNVEKALDLIEEMKQSEEFSPVQLLYQMANVYARIGKNKEAFECLNRLIDEADNDVIQELKIQLNDYDLAPLRDMPEFKELLKRIPEPEDADESTDSADNIVGYTTEIVEVPFTREAGVTKVKCTINDLPLHFVFDTGASDVTISMVEANFMVKNGYIKKNDVVGKTQYLDASGNINEGTVINLRKVNFGGLELDNVRASVVNNQQAPLLLGQSVLSRLGKIEIDNAGRKLRVTHKVKK